MWFIVTGIVVALVVAFFLGRRHSQVNGQNGTGSAGPQDSGRQSPR